MVSRNVFSTGRYGVGQQTKVCATSWTSGFWLEYCDVNGQSVCILYSAADERGGGVGGGEGECEAGVAGVGADAAGGVSCSAGVSSAVWGCGVCGGGGGGGGGDAGFAGGEGADGGCGFVFGGGAGA